MKNLFRILVFAVLVGCGGGNTNEKESDAKGSIFQLDRSPVEVLQGKIKIKITSNFPEAYVEEGNTISIKPYLENGDGGTQEFQENTFTKGKDFVEGQNIEYVDSVEYDTTMNFSNLYLDVIITDENGEKSDKTKIKLGDGVINTSNLLEYNYRPIYPNKNSLPSGSGNKSSLFNFKKNSAAVNKRDLSSENFKSLKKVTNQKDISINSVDIIGYASPEGPVKFNENLSINRAKAVKNAVKKTFDKNDDFYVIRGEGPDWNGFFEMLVMKNIPDKELIKSTLENESMLEARADILKGFVEAYPQIEDEILSKLRRVELKISYTTGVSVESKEVKSNEELIVLVEEGDMNKLSYEDLLEAIVLVSSDKRISLSQELINKNPQDYRSYAVYGVALWEDGNKVEAENNFLKSFEIEQNELTKNNMAVSKIDNKKYDEAKALLKDARSDQSKYNRGVIYLLENDYRGAVSYMGNENKFNRALLTIIEERENERALELISSVDSTDSNIAKYEYIRAVAYARMGNVEKTTESINKFSQIDEKLAQRAQKDLEFRNILNQDVTDVTEEGGEEEENVDEEEENVDEEEENVDEEEENVDEEMGDQVLNYR